MALPAASCEMSVRNDSVGEILAHVADFAEVRPVVFDREKALSQLGGMEELLLDVITLMTTEGLRLHAGMHEALNRGNAVELKRAAHTLKGSVLLMGAADLARRLKQIEGFAAVGDLKGAADELPEIDRQFKELQRRLEFELNSL